MEVVDDNNEAPLDENEVDNNQSNEELHAEDSEEEDECRVCRGPAEEGRPLYGPCKCSGSIGLTHQDCLMSWLEVTRGDGRCELCKTKFQFDPQYAPNAPYRLPAHEVILGLSSRAVAKWLPLGIRFLIAASLWLVVAPLLTDYLYHGWMHRPSSILTRWKRELLPADIVSGAVVAAVIIISFLSLMSFADFLRVHWQQAPARRGEENEDRRQGAGANDMANGFADDAGAEDMFVDNAIVNFVDIRGAMQEHFADLQGVMQGREEESEGDYSDDGDDDDDDDDDDDADDANDNDDDSDEVQRERLEHRRLMPQEDDQNRQVLQAQAALGNELAQQRERRRQRRAAAPQHQQANFLAGNERVEPLRDEERNDRENIDNAQGQDIFANQLLQALLPDARDSDGEDSDNDAPPLIFRGDVNDGDDGEDGEDDDSDDDNEEDNRDDEPLFPPLRNDDRIERPFDPMDPVMQDDQVDMEINVALDELLGLRGPLSTLVRNLLWMLAFNATYLGIFAFIPRTVGSAIYAGVFNTTACSGLLKKLPYVYSENPDNVTVMGLLSSLNEESYRLDTSFRLPDLTTVTLGYFSMALAIVFIRYSWLFAHKVKTRFTPEQPHGNIEEEAHLLLHGRPRREGAQLHGFDDQDAMEHGGASVAVGLALDATVAVVKVGILLFLKMFLLPLLLGLWLDASTTTLFGHDVADRIAYAASDLFSFVLLHWVAGITFMLLVTVFLLQLREVTHPDVLARLIRPQEPQPDLLGNLMNETVSTHMKRMFLSLGIYAPLLTMHVTIPVKLVVASGLGNYFSFFRLHFWHLLMPQMQIPLELIIFHLSMLALLERYKNTIGELQHHWLVFMCRQMGLTDYILPRSIEKFQLVGQKALFLSEDAERAPDQEKLKEPLDLSPNQRTDVKVDPFWYELSSKREDICNFILSNIKEDTSENPVFIDGETLLNGERVVSRAVTSIRLPAKEEEQDNGTPEQDNQYLIPMTIGRFRLRRVGPPDAASVVEFWQEVPGGDIPRPPEGWDDLGAGGAFVQGRWAWGKERRSIVEGSVAQRTPFREPGKKHRPIHLMMKVAALITCSWIAITFTIFGIVSTPLAVGRSFYYLFRVPQQYIHDPFAFCMGGCLFFPVASLVASTIKEAARHSTMTDRFQRWISRFHLPPQQKLLIFLESMLLWTFIAPLALGVTYEIGAVKLRTWFAGEERLFDPVSIALCWTVGAVVLNSWAFFSYYSVFTGEFWTNIGNGILEPPLDENDGAGEVARNNRNARGAAAENAGELADGQMIRAWQGKDGRVAKFFGVWKAVLCRWEWESVDKVPLLEDFARPITRQLASTVVGSSLSFQLSFVLAEKLLQVEQNGIVVPIFGLVEHGLFRLLLFRTCMTFHIIVQLCSSFRRSLESWFRAAHKAARDDRYLVGEVLMNYVPPENV